MEKGILTEHSSSQFNNDVQQLFNAVLKLGSLVELQFQQSQQAIDNQDLELANQVLIMDRKVNKEQANLDNLVTQLLVQHNPAAFDLRMVLMAYKSASDLERMGDEISILSKFVVRRHNEGKKLKKISSSCYDYLNKLISLAALMLKISLDGFSKLESEVFSVLMEHEKKMDRLYGEACAKIKNYALENSNNVDEILDLILLCRAMERVADHTLNIGEYVFYMIEGKTIRQISKDKLKEKIHKANY